MLPAKEQIPTTANLFHVAYKILQAKSPVRIVTTVGPIHLVGNATGATNKYVKTFDSELHICRQLNEI